MAGVSQAFATVLDRFEKLKNDPTDSHEARVQRAYARLKSMHDAQEDLRAYWLPQIGKALASRKLSVNNKQLFGYSNCDRPYREELQRLLGEPFSVQFRVVIWPYGLNERCYCEVVW